jgi:hypothetical protein
MRPHVEKLEHDRLKWAMVQLFLGPGSRERAAWNCSVKAERKSALSLPFFKLYSALFYFSRCWNSYFGLESLVTMFPLPGDDDSCR